MDIVTIVPFFGLVSTHIPDTLKTPFNYPIKHSSTEASGAVLINPKSFPQPKTAEVVKFGLEIWWRRLPQKKRSESTSEAVRSQEEVDSEHVPRTVRIYMGAVETLLQKHSTISVQPPASQ